MFLFGAMYFVQGIAEPTEGLIAQPVRSMLKSWGHSTAEIARISAIISIPWSLKPIYGLLTDFVPFWGMRRRSYLLVASTATTLSLLTLFGCSPPHGALPLLLTLLLIPTLGVAFADVVVDALLVEKGRPLGLTGRLQAIQWGALYTAGMLASLLGGYLSGIGQQNLSFLICGSVTLLTVVLTWWYVDETPGKHVGDKTERVREVVGRLAASKPLWATALFIFLWSFNPFSSTVLYMYTTSTLGLSEAYHGMTMSLLSLGAILASCVYPTYCRRVAFHLLLHASVVGGILSTLAYWWMEGPRTAVVISIMVGFFYMTGSLILLDLAARSCPMAAAGTSFALLMAIANLGMILSGDLGGQWFDRWAAQWGPHRAFQLVVLVGAAANCVCFPLIPYLTRAVASLSPDDKS